MVFEPTFDSTEGDGEQDDLEFGEDPDIETSEDPDAPLGDVSADDLPPQGA